MLCTRCLRTAFPSQNLLRTTTRYISTSRPFLSEAAPPLSTPISSPGDAAPAAAPKISSCPEGTVMKGLNYLKNGEDPVAMKDEEYPAWLWECLEVTEKTGAGEEDLDDEFSKSKKKRKQAMKRKREIDEKLLAEGNFEALEPKVPLQHQSVNLPGKEGGSTEENLAAKKARDELMRAMRVERKAKIKERNYLQSM
ncbi:54S ribosomal protein-like protein [Emericellopsis cladophorae]|uniref:Large ribosomal subunit protein mL54 n=1 Tax=Emericellopsis cladophorae TaxID=2686198 RepID=A0A9Q0BIA0_9HYPO|nr:54S ribosomal protein-like protein [Emericellopsis cladophorae]KAI6785630.1 54S ribosomal protein-like protein [Emericellopsis cladophorae]